MLNKIFGMLSEKKMVPVGIVVGELHDAWKRNSIEEIIWDFELEAKKSEFFLDYVKRQVVDGKLQIDVDELEIMVNDAFKKECAGFITNHNRRAFELSKEEGELWSQTYEQLDIPSDREYKIDVMSGEVFEVVIGGDSDETN